MIPLKKHKPSTSLSFVSILVGSMMTAHLLALVDGTNDKIAAGIDTIGWTITHPSGDHHAPVRDGSITTHCILFPDDSPGDQILCSTGSYKTSSHTLYDVESDAWVASGAVTNSTIFALAAWSGNAFGPAVVTDDKGHYYAIGRTGSSLVATKLKMALPHNSIFVGAALFSIGGVLMQFGGLSTKGIFYNDLFYYNPVDNHWETASRSSPPLPRCYFGSSAVSLSLTSGVLYVYGGVEISKTYADLWIGVISLNGTSVHVAWQKLPSQSPAALSQVGMVFAGSSLWIVGGTNTDGVYTVFNGDYRYDTARSAGNSDGVWTQFGNNTYLEAGPELIFCPSTDRIYGYGGWGYLSESTYMFYVTVGNVTQLSGATANAQKFDEDVTLTFPHFDSPSLLLAPNQGTVPPEEQSHVALTPIKMEEWDPLTKKSVANVSFPANAYYSYHDTVDHGEVLRYYFARNLGLTQVYFEYQLYAVPTKLNFAGVPFGIDAGVTKFTLSVKNWPWKSPKNTLKVYFAVETNPATVSISHKEVAPHITAVTFTTSSSFAAKIELIDRAIVDNIATSQGVNFSFPSTSELVVDLPHFKSSVIYDPNLSVLINTGDGSSDSLLGLIALAAVPVVVVVIVAVIAAGSFVTWQKRRSRIRRLTSTASSLDEQI